MGQRDYLNPAGHELMNPYHILDPDDLDETVGPVETDAADDADPYPVALDVAEGIHEKTDN